MNPSCRGLRRPRRRPPCYRFTSRSSPPVRGRPELPARRHLVRTAAVAGVTGSAAERIESAAEGTEASTVRLGVAAVPVPAVAAEGCAAAAAVVGRSEETAESAADAACLRSRIPAGPRTVGRIAVETSGCQTAGPHMESIPTKFPAGETLSAWQIRTCFLVGDPLHLLDTLR